MDIKKSGLKYLKHHFRLNNLAKWAFRYIKFSIIGIFVWLISSAVNKHSKGVMFESCLPSGEVIEFQIKKKDHNSKKAGE